MSNTQDKATLDPTDKTPRFQPGSADPSNSEFGSSEIWWWNNGVWGESGYAIPNDGGKSATGNETVWGIHDFIGAEMFALMHLPDVKLSRPFNAEWLFKLNRLLTLGIKRISDRSVGWGDDREGDAEHAINTPRSFMVYPVPYFGGRIRQRDALRWCGWTLQLLSEIMQHSDNTYDDDVTDVLGSMVQKGLNRIRKDMAMKYLGMSRDQVEDPAFTVPADAFDKGKYNPASLFTERELVEERMPNQWWPQTNDLTPINGIPINVANIWKQRWPHAAGFRGDGGAHEAAFPGGGGGIISSPGARGTVSD